MSHTLKNTFSVNLGLPTVPLTQNPELYTELTRIYNALRALTNALDMESLHSMQE